jgi:hypothetical protein
MNKRGQATTEMVLLMPLLVVLLGAAMFVAYACWQGIKVQQAANFAARIQGQERVSGGRTEPEINSNNGIDGEHDDDPTNSDPSEKYTKKSRSDLKAHSVYGKFFNLAKGMFSPGVRDQVFVPLPKIGQNVDEVKVIRLIDLPKLPFMKESSSFGQIKLEGTAWGGESPSMYALPRWGNGPNGEPAWKGMVRDSAKAGNHDE